MTKEDLLKLSPGELVDMGICPTCFNRETGGAVYGDNSDKRLYEDSEKYHFPSRKYVLLS